MKSIKNLLLIMLFTLLSFGLVSCGGAKKEVANADTGAKKAEPAVLKLAHNLNEQHSVHLALVEFAKKIEEKTNGEVKVEIYPNGQLGSESEVLEQLQAGAVAMTKVSAAALTTYDEGYNAFTLPYVFNDEAHFFKSMESPAVENLYMETKDKGFVGLTFYNSGARSFYTKDKAILKPEDLKGLKIRVMGFQSQTDMVQVLGGTPVGMSMSETYTALQSGVIDGAESNETVLTTGKHGEVCKQFSLDEHTRIPDILVISSKVWDKLTEAQQKAVKESAVESTAVHKDMWTKAIDAAVKESTEKMGVTFNKVDKAPFRQAVEPMLQKYSTEMPKVKTLLEEFKNIK